MSLVSLFWSKLLRAMMDKHENDQTFCFHPTPAILTHIFIFFLILCCSLPLLLCSDSEKRSLLFVIVCFVFFLKSNKKNFVEWDLWLGLISESRMFSGDEMISDTFKLELVDNIAWKVSSFSIKKGGETFDIGANASAEGEDADAGADDQVEMVNNVVDAFRLQVLNCPVLCVFFSLMFSLCSKWEWPKSPSWATWRIGWRRWKHTSRPPSPPEWLISRSHSSGLDTECLIRRISFGRPKRRPSSRRRSCLFLTILPSTAVSRWTLTVEWRWCSTRARTRTPSSTFSRIGMALPDWEHFPKFSLQFDSREVLSLTLHTILWYEACKKKKKEWIKVEFEMYLFADCEEKSRRNRTLFIFAPCSKFVHTGRWKSCVHRSMKLPQHSFPERPQKKLKTIWKGLDQYFGFNADRSHIDWDLFGIQPSRASHLVDARLRTDRNGIR